MQSLNQFLRITDTRLSLYELKKVNQLNLISAYCAALAGLLAVINAFLFRHPQLIIDLSIILIIFLPVILIQKKGYYQVASNYFTSLMLLMMTGICLYNINRNEFLQTENVYLTLAPALVILYEKRKKVIIYSITVLLFFGIHAHAYQSRGLSLDDRFYTNSMVYLVVFLGIFYFVSSYKNAFYKIYHEQMDLLDLLKKQKDELEKTDETKNKLFSIVAHDLKRPMHMLTGLLSMEGMIPENEHKQYRKQVRENVKGINGLIENVLTWAKSQLEGFSVNIQQTEIDQIFSSEQDVYKEQAEVKGIALTSQIPKNLKVWSDPNHISIVIRNIVNNSIKFTPKHGQISISASTNNDHVDIVIKDTGIGMNEETIQLIKNQKFVSSTNGTQGESGSGLGLVLCTETLEKLGGRLLIKSQKDKGSQFTIQLPLN